MPGRTAPWTPSEARPTQNNSTLTARPAVNADSLGHSPSFGTLAGGAGSSVDLLGISHLEAEHPVGVDPHVHRTAVEELLPIGAVARHVHLE